MPRGTLDGYKPEAPKEGSAGAFKGEVVCKVNEAILKEYDMPEDSPYYNAEYVGTKSVSIELEVVKGEFEGRRLWKRFLVDSDQADSKGKTPIQKLADYLISADTKLTGTTDEEIKKALAEFSILTLNVKAYYFEGSDGKEVQMHIIKGLATPEEGKGGVPF